MEAPYVKKCCTDEIETGDCSSCLFVFEINTKCKKKEKESL